MVQAGVQISVLAAVRSVPLVEPRASVALVVGPVAAEASLLDEAVTNHGFGYASEAACTEFGFVALVAVGNYFHQVYHCPAIEHLGPLVALAQEHVNATGFGVNTEEQRALGFQQPDLSLDYLVDLAPQQAVKNDHEKPALDPGFPISVDSRSGFAAVEQAVVAIDHMLFRARRLDPEN